MSTIHNRTILLIFLLIHFTAYTAFSQISAIDKLEKKLSEHASADTTKVNLLNKLGYELYANDKEKAESYANQALKIATQSGYPEGKAASLWIKGLVTMRDNKKAALQLFEEALHIAEQVNDKTGICNYLMAISNIKKELGDIKGCEQALEKGLETAATLKDPSPRIKLLFNVAYNLSSKGEYSQAVEVFQQVIHLAGQNNNKLMAAKSYSKIALIHHRQGSLPQALEYYLSALKIYEEQNDRQGICNALINIAGIKSEQNEFEAALEDINQALLLSKEMNNEYLISSCLTNIGYIYKRMKRPEALQYLREALGMVEGKRSGQSINLLTNIASIYIEQGKFEEAKTHLYQALNLAQQSNIKYAHAEVLGFLSKLYYTQKQYARAIEYADHALQIGNEIKYLELRKNIYGQLADIYSTTGNFKDAYHNHKMFKQLNDSILNESNIRKLTLIESAYKHDKEIQKYEIEKIKQQLHIKHQYYTILSLSAVMLLITILSFQLYRSNKLKKKVLKLEIDQINNKLEYSKKEMTSATLKLMQNAESDSYCIKMLENIAKATPEEREKEIHTLICYYKNKSAYSNWKEFETLFLEVNANFYDKLNKNFPSLTVNERKICVFLRLNMGNKDIAQITFQSEEALKKARLRLRKKLGIERTDNLATFIQSL